MPQRSRVPWVKPCPHLVTGGCGQPQTGGSLTSRMILKCPSSCTWLCQSLPTFIFFNYFPCPTICKIDKLFKYLNPLKVMKKSSWSDFSPSLGVSRERWLSGRVVPAVLSFKTTVIPPEIRHFQQEWSIPLLDIWIPQPALHLAESTFAWIFLLWFF